MKDDRDGDYTYTDENGYSWIVDAQGNPLRVRGRLVPGPPKRATGQKINPNSTWRLYDDRQGHCALCGRLACSGTCVK